MENFRLSLRRPQRLST